jgi:hypothetical protein
MKNLFFYLIASVFVIITSAYVLTSAYAKHYSKNVLPPHKELKSSSIYGDFEGRIPCQEIARELNLKVSAACDKRKVAPTLYQDSITHKPTSYKIRGMGEKTGEGKWHIIKGSTKDKRTVYFQLDMGDKVLYLYKGDENVLFFLDKNKNFLPGNAKFSYTLNRIRNQKSWDNWRYLSNRGESF